jgi:galactokinase
VSASKEKIIINNSENNKNRSSSETLTSRAKDQIQSAMQRFAEQFPDSPKPRWIAQAPGRVNLIGEHVDYNGGYVLPAAIDFYTTFVAAPASGNEVVIRTESDPQTQVRIPIQTPVPKGEPYWSQYLRGTLNGCLEAGLQPSGINVWIQTNVPMGAGLSSSAALEVGFATLIEEACDKKIDPIQKALLCQRAENIYAEAPCGFMDQFASTMGRLDHFLKIDCKDQSVEYIPMNDPQWTLWIVHSGASHSIATSEYGQRRRDCDRACELLGISSLREMTLERLGEVLDQKILDPRIEKRVRHVVSEIQRANEASTALRQSDWLHLGDLMKQSHASMRDDYEITCEEVDWLVEQIEQLQGTLGVIAVMRTEAMEKSRQILEEAFYNKYGKSMQNWVTRPVDGSQGMNLSFL